MGSKRRDRYTVADWREACPNVAAMRRAAWTVVGVCQICDLEFDVDLGAVETVKGPEYRLWGKTRDCPRRWCEGKAAFFVQPPGASMEIRMVE